MKLINFFAQYPKGTAIRRTVSVHLVKGVMVATEDDPDDGPCLYSLTVADLQADDWESPHDIVRQKYLEKLRELTRFAQLTDGVLLQIIDVMLDDDVRRSLTSPRR